MKNYKIEMEKLEKIKQSHLYDIKQLRDEVSMISEKISEFQRLHNENNKSSIEANRILNDRSRQNVSEVLLYFMMIFTEFGSGRPKSILNKIDYSRAIKDEEFFNQVVIAIGKATIDEIFKNILRIETIDGESVAVTRNKTSNTTNMGNRLFSKFTKKSLEDYIIRHGYIK